MAILEKANYLSYYARSKNGPSRNGFYGKNYLRNSSQKFGGDENYVVGVLPCLPTSVPSSGNNVPGRMRVLRMVRARRIVESLRVSLLRHLNIKAMAPYYCETKELQAKEVARSRRILRRSLMIWV